MGQPKQNDGGLLNVGSFLDSYQWLIALIGIGCFFIGLFYPFEDAENSVYKQLFSKTGEILLVGVLIGFLSSHKQIINSYRSELHGIIYDDKFLKNRKDIEDVWIRTSKVLFKSKFPKISIDLLQTIKKSYLPVNEVSYYNDYSATITIEWVGDDHKFIKVMEDVSFELLAESTAKFTLPSRNWIKIEGLLEKQYGMIVEQYLVNDEKAKIIKNQSCIENNILVSDVDVELKGSEKYKINRRYVKTYSIDKDYHIGFKPKYIVNNLVVRCFHPNDMSVCFIQRGTAQDFEEKFIKPNACEYQYKGLILPRQGYVLLLQHKTC